MTKPKTGTAGGSNKKRDKGSGPASRNKAQHIANDLRAKLPHHKVHSSGTGRLTLPAQGARARGPFPGGGGGGEGRSVGPQV